MQVEEWLLPISKARCGKKLRGFCGVTIHETANTAPTANAKSHAVYMNQNGGKDREVSYHYVVDAQQAFHLVPDDEVAWHAGDGASGKGNNETIAIEICVNAGGNFQQAVDNAAALAAQLLYRRGVKSAEGRIFEHHDFSSYQKNCPANLRAGVAGGMAHLRAKVQQVLTQLWGTAEVPPKKSPDSLYRVQVGAFAAKEGAERYADQLRKAGYPCFVVVPVQG
ncbi:MAG: N-acetylmuramoyl-L-alanine amidase [Pygmaiobacter massiliensis]|nr:N-acetylmuramoyl-L-alanine amidase [Pygmaiobacter massiliensis]